MDKIKANLIIEIMGRPPKHIAETLNTIVIKIGSEKGVELINKKFHKPKSIKDAKNLYMTFSEVEAEFENLDSFFTVIFNYMPSNVEIFDPEKIKLNNYDLNTLSNFILSRLHKYDAIAKGIMTERNIMMKQLEDLRKQGVKLEILDQYGKSAEKIGTKGVKKKT